MTLSPHDEDLLLERPPVVFDEQAIAGRFQGAAIMIVGAGGSIGGQLARTLAGHRPSALLCVDRHEASLHRVGRRLREDHPELAPRLVFADVCDTARLLRLIEEHRIDCVFQLAAYKHVHLAEEIVDQVVAVNVLASLRLADLAAAAGVRDFVYPSTDKAVRPPSIYGATKRIVELELARRAREGRRCATARLVNVFATAGNVIETFAEQIGRGQPLTVTDPRMTRHWMTSREAVLLLASAACLARVDEPIMVPLGEPTPLTRTISRLSKLLVGRPSEIRMIGIRPGERLHEELTYPHERLEPSELAGVLRVHSDRAPDDVRTVVAELDAAVSIADEPRVRAIIGQVVEAAVAA